MSLCVFAWGNTDKEDRKRWRFKKKISLWFIFFTSEALFHLPFYSQCLWVPHMHCFLIFVFHVCLMGVESQHWGAARTPVIATHSKRIFIYFFDELWAVTYSAHLYRQNRLHTCFYPSGSGGSEKKLAVFNKQLIKFWCDRKSCSSYHCIIPAD